QLNDDGYWEQYWKPLTKQLRLDRTLVRLLLHPPLAVELEQQSRSGGAEGGAPAAAEEATTGAQGTPSFRMAEEPSLPPSHGPPTIRIKKAPTSRRATRRRPLKLALLNRALRRSTRAWYR